MEEHFILKGRSFVFFGNLSGFWELQLKDWLFQKILNTVEMKQTLTKNEVIFSPNNKFS